MNKRVIPRSTKFIKIYFTISLFFILKIGSSIITQQSLISYNSYHLSIGSSFLQGTLCIFLFCTLYEPTSYRLFFCFLYS